MIITCEACNASFNLDESRIAPSGSKVRCSKCKKVFIAYPPAPTAEEEPLQKNDTVPDIEKTDALEFGLDFEMDAHEKEGDGDTREDEVTEELDLSNLELELDLEQGRDDSEIDEFKELELELEDLDQMESLASETGTGLKDSEERQTTDEPESDDLVMEPGELELADAGDIDKAEGDLELILDDLDELGVLSSETQSTEDEALTFEDEEDLDLGNFDLALDEAKADQMGNGEEAAESDIFLGEKTESEEIETEEMLGIDSPIEVENDEELTFEGLDESDIAAREAATPKADLFEVEEISIADDSFSMGDDKEGPEIAKPEPSKPFSAGGGIKISSVSPASEPAKKRTSLWIVGLLIVVLLFGGTYFMLDYLGIEIPYISDLIAPSKNLDTQGNFKITLLGYKGNFIDNVHAGKLYVIRGQARNDYAEPRGFIRITGSLYSEAKMLIKKQTVFCGNILSDLDLTNLEFNAIQKRLQNRPGDNGSNIRLAPGKQLPFMIVFSDLPDRLEEFRLDVGGSLKAQ